MLKQNNNNDSNPVVTREMFVSQQMAFHKQSLLGIKNKLGKDCSYLSYMRYGDSYGLKAIIKGKSVDVALGGKPSDVDGKSYKELLDKLLEYVKEENKSLSN